MFTVRDHVPTFAIDSRKIEPPFVASVRKRTRCLSRAQPRGDNVTSMVPLPLSPSIVTLIGFRGPNPLRISVTELLAASKTDSPTRTTVGCERFVAPGWVAR